MKSTLNHRGKASNHRQVILFCVPPLVLLPLSAWFGLSIYSGKLQDIPTGLTAFLAALSGILVTWGGVNKGLETVDAVKNPPPPAAP